MSSEPLPKLEYFYTDSFFVKSEDVVDEFGIPASAIPFPSTKSVKDREQAIVERLKEIKLDLLDDDIDKYYDIAINELIEDLERGI